MQKRVQCMINPTVAGQMLVQLAKFQSASVYLYLLYEVVLAIVNELTNLRCLVKMTKVIQFSSVKLDLQ